MFEKVKRKWNDCSRKWSVLDVFVRLPSGERVSFDPRQKIPKTLPLKRRDGSVKRKFTSNLQISTLHSLHKCNFFHSVKI